jgi:glycerol-3-phosphate dehydrogenase (NAD(P)+)
MNNFYQAMVKCAAVGKRMCTETEWSFACEGPEMKPFPYGFKRDPTKCNGDQPWDHPQMGRVGRFDAEELSRLWKGVPNGAQPDCVSDFGVPDLPGNTDDVVANDSYRKGGIYANFESVNTGGPWYKGVRNACRPKVYSHNEGFAYYYLGFRCCAEADGRETDPRTPRMIETRGTFRKVEQYARFTVAEMKEKLALKAQGKCVCQDADALCKVMCGTLLPTTAVDIDLKAPRPLGCVAMATVVILGAGMMGSALALPLVDRGHEVRLVGTHLDEEIIESLRARGEHPKLKLALPPEIKAYRHTELDVALIGAEAVALGVNSRGVSWAIDRLRPFAASRWPLFMITKGLELRDDHLLSFPDLVSAELGVPSAAIAGPCIAGELARRVETCVVLAGRDRPALDHLAALLRGPYYHVFTSEDVVGVEACAALKNAYAMGIAFALGIHERHGGVAGSVAMHNHESAVFAQAAVEMTHLATALGGDGRSALGLPGVGDLDVTTNGGRTGRFGKLLGLGLSAPEAVARMEGATLECLDILATLRAGLPAYERRGKLRLADLPLLTHLGEVALDGRPVAMPFARFFGGER